MYFYLYFPSKENLNLGKVLVTALLHPHDDLQGRHAKDAKTWVIGVHRGEESGVRCDFL